HIASTIAPGFDRTMQLARALAEGITPERFARCPAGHPGANHPAFVFGHLAIYPDRALALVGRSDLAQPRERYNELFSPSARNRDDPDASIYPPMDEILAYFNERHETIGSVIATVPDEVLGAQMPDEGFRARFPTVGAGVVFLLGHHMMFHLGQLSTWRRFEGMRPAMPHVE
ncbi:MAG: DinB family protein, partial [Planctomycetota bacterium]